MVKNISGHDKKASVKPKNLLETNGLHENFILGSRNFHSRLRAASIK